jgi:hypothetical protein
MAALASTKPRRKEPGIMLFSQGVSFRDELFNGRAKRHDDGNEPAQPVSWTGDGLHATPIPHVAAAALLPVAAILTKFPSADVAPAPPVRALA